MKKFFVSLYKFVFGPLVRMRVRNILDRLYECPNLKNFTSHRWGEKDLCTTLYIIEKAVKDGFITWQKMEMNSAQLTGLYNGQIMRLVALYELSFRTAYWQSYAHAVNGLRVFNTLAFKQSEDLLSEESYECIRQFFAREIYRFLRLGNSSFSRYPLSHQTAIGVLMENHGFAENDFSAVYSDPSMITHQA